MSKLLRDSRRNAVQTFVKKPGTCVDKIVDSSIPETFTPNPPLETTYEVRTTGDIRIAAHDADYTFVKETEPRMWATEIDFISLGGSTGRTTITVVGDTGAATVSFTECL